MVSADVLNLYLNQESAFRNTLQQQLDDLNQNMTDLQTQHKQETACHATTTIQKCDILEETIGTISAFNAATNARTPEKCVKYQQPT